MKKRSLYAALAALTLTGVASTAMANNASPFDGFYAGLSGGGSFATSNVTNIGNFNAVFSGGLQPNITASPVTISTNSIKNSGIGELFLGYGHTWDAFYLGAELFGNYSNYEMNNSGSVTLTHNLPLSFTQTLYAQTNNEVKLSPVQFGADLLPGALLTPNTLLYGRVGVAAAKMTVNSNVTATYIDSVLGVSNTLPSITTSTSNSSNKAVLRLGAGLEQHLDQNWSIRADYIYSYYGKTNLNSPNISTLVSSPNLGAGAITANDSINAKSSDNAVLLGLSYSIPTSAF